MHDETIGRILASEQFRILRRRRARLTWGLTALLIGLYLVFGLIAVWLPDLMAQPINTGSKIPLGLVAAYVIVIAAIVLAGYYAHRMNVDLGPLTERLRDEFDMRRPDA